MPHDPPRMNPRAGTLSGCVAACLLAASQVGCTSTLTTAYLRGGPWDAEHAAETAEPAPDADSGELDTAVAHDASEEAPDGARREAALEEAMNRLSRLGPLDPAVEAALVATLQRTQPEDWPVVVDEFAASLPAAGTVSPAPPVAAVTAALPESSSASPAPPGTDAPTATGEPPTAPGEIEPAAPAEPAPVVAAAAEAEDPADDEATAADPPADEPVAPEDTSAPALVIRSACFASAVRAWGDVDRFATDRFRPGQEVIVYVELDNLAVTASPSGHTTCVDAGLRLVGADDTTIHTWTFEPLAETCPGRRRDYFARYVVRIPESVPPGGCRIDVSVTDTLAGTTADSSLPLEIAAVD